MKVFTPNIGEVNLTQKNFLAKGGEGTVYSKKSVAYKIYENPDTMIPYGKIQELSVLELPQIIKPEEIIRDKDGVIIGYTMRYVKNTHALCSLFPKKFRLRHNITNDIIVNLVKIFRKIIEYVHSKNILVVDLNELNFLVANKFDDMYAIDVNSYQTTNFPATVVMPSILDRHCNNHFDAGTDWFSWGIVSCRMLLGIHPYKGKHKDFKKIPLGDRMNARMKANVSIFHDEVSVPAACQSFDIIPQVLKDWYIAVFEDGEREPPPDDFFAVTIKATTKIKRISGSDSFNVEELFEYDSEILEVICFEGTRIVVTQDKVFMNQKEYQIPHD
ncbi:MAG: protein kinase domain-containing protein, partial [Petrotogales bacterium]